MCVGGKEEYLMDCMAGGRRVFGITGDWSITALDTVFGKTKYAMGVVCLWPRW